MSRTQHLLTNAKINVTFFLVNILITFFSRKFFINNLGADFLGLNSTISNLLSFLLLAELGFGTAITYLLYKPLATNNFTEVNKIINLLEYYYKRLGILIGLLGLILSSFLFFIFRNTNLSTNIIYISFYSYLVITVIEYVFNFRQLLVYADQKAFVIKTTIGIISILKIISQVFVISVFGPNLYLFLFLEVCFAVLKSIKLNSKIKETYPWLKTDQFRNDDKIQQKDILKKTRQIFSHQIGGFILNQTDQLLIYIYTSLKMVTFYNNYLMVVQYAVTLTIQPFLSIHSGIGNLVVSSTKEKSYKVFQDLLFLKYWLAGSIIPILYLTIDAFINLWLGSNYILDRNIIVVLLLNFFINIVRKPLDVFLQAFGIFNDTWAPWTEAGLNLILSLILGYFYGIFGILTSTFISVSLIVCLWKPYLLFNKGFNLPVTLYFKKVFTFLILSIVTAIITCYTIKYLLLDLNFENNYIEFAINICLTSILFVTLYSFLLILFVKESKYLIDRFKNLWR